MMTTADGADARKPAKADRSRDPRSDELKAIAILSVVGIHAGLPYSEVLRFCVPVFVAIWAYHFEQGLERRSDHWAYVRDRLILTFIPYAFWTALYLLIAHPVHDWVSTPLHTIAGGWFGGYGWAGQYFFIILFQLTVLMPLLRGLVTKETLWPLLLLGFAASIASDYYLFRYDPVRAVGDRLFVYWLPYAVLGIALARGYAPQGPWFLAALLLFVAPAEMGRLSGAASGASAYLLASVSAGSMGLILALGPHGAETPPPRAKEAGSLLKLLHYVGRNSMAIFVCNPLLLGIASSFVPQGSEGGLGMKLGLVLAAVAGSLGVASALRKLGLGVLVGASRAR